MTDDSGDRRQYRQRDTILIIIQGVTAILAIAALVAVLVISDQERTRARYDSCRLLRAVVLVATPPARHRQALLFLARTSLRNCHTYSEHP